MEVFSTHIIEWFVVPLAMYLLLFWWRDNLNILHMPLADLVALLVIADVAIALNFSALPDVLKFLRADGEGAAHTPFSFLALAGLGVMISALLIYKIEKKILSTALRHISVGLWHKPSIHYLPFWATFRNAKWQIFMARWALGFGVSAAVIAVHLIAVGIYPLGPLDPYFARVNNHWLIEIVLGGFGIFLLFLGLGTIFTLLRFFRFSSVPLS
jgi:hypothetical protein